MDKSLENEYHKWLEHAADYDWWDGMVGAFCAHVPYIDYVWEDTLNFDLDRGSYCRFRFDYKSRELLEAMGLYEKYPLQCEQIIAQYENNLRVHPEYNRMGYSVDCMDFHPYGVGMLEGVSEEAVAELMEGFYAAIDFEKEIKEFTQANVFDELLKDLNDEYEHITSEERFLDERERLLGQQEEARHVCH